MTVPARQGASWLRSGARVFARQPLAFSGLFAAFLFAVFVLMLLPAIGALLALALLPLGSLGFMIATRTALDDRFPLPRVFVEPLRAGRARAIAMAGLGAIYALCSVGIIAISGWVDSGALEALMQTLADGQSTPEDVAQRLADPRLEAGLLLRLVLTAALAVPFWHAPALVHWGAQGVAQSLFSSTIACWRNKGAFAVFALAWGAVLMGFALLANLVAALLGQPGLIALLAMPASLILSTMFYASLYFSFADCFELNGGPPPSSPPPALEPPKDMP